ncbi:phage tail tape measure protein [Streptomyces sp. NPDC002755]
MAGDQRTLRVVIVGNADSAQDALDGLAESSADAGGQVEAMGGKFQGLKAGLMGMGAAVLAALPVAALMAFSNGLDEIANRSKLAASMGLEGKDAEKAGSLAGDLYVSGFGESTAETGEIVKRVAQDLNMSVNSVDFKPIASQAASLAKAFDQEIGPTTAAVGQMLKTGLAKNATEAMDILTRGFQSGANKADDLLDTVNEYGTQWRKFGLDGKVAMGLLSQGLKAGARDADVVADSIKEFSIRAIDGSATTAAGFKAIGLDADKMAARIAKGGSSATSALDETLDKLRQMPDKNKRAATAVQLFGTQAEDLGDALYSLDPSAATGALGKVEGAATKMANTLNNNAAAKWETFKRRLSYGATDMAAKTITAFSGISNKVSPIFSGLGQKAKPFVDQFTQKLSGIWAVVGPSLQQFSAYFRSDLIPVIQDLWAKAKPVLDLLWETFKTNLDFIKLEIQGFILAVQFLWQTFGSTILGTLKAVFATLMQIITGALNIIRGIYNLFIGVFTGDWSRAWQGIKQIFSGIWDVIAGVFRGVLLAITATFKIVMAGFKGVWNLAWSAVSSFFKGIWSRLSGYVSSGMNAMKGYASSGATAVKNFFINGFNSLYNGAKAKLNAVITTVRGLPAKVKATLSGLPAEMLSIGQNIIAGIVNGIKNKLGDVMSAAQSIVDKIPGPIKKAMGIHSPSRVMAEIGKWITAGLVKGMLGGSKSVEATSKKLQGYITKAFKAGNISKGKADGLHKYVSAQNTKLKKLAKQREAVASQITAANTKLADMKKAKADLAVSVADKARDFGSFMGAFDSSEYGDNSASAVLSRLKGKLSGIINFRKNLATLASRGLGRGIINEIAQAGPNEGGQMAEALLNSGVGEISELNSTFNSISSESSKLGTFAASNYYDAGIAATEGLIKGLQSKQSSLTAAITKMAESMVKTLKKKLGIKSPSRVFRAQGNFTGEGFALGVEDQQGAVQDAVNTLAGTRPTGRLANSSLAREAAVVAATSSAASPTVHVTVQGNVTAEKALAKSIAGTIRDEIVRQGKRNGGRTGL